MKKQVSLILLATSINEFSAAFLLFPIGVYWQLDKIHGRKWNYFANFFNSIITEKLNSRNNELDKCKLLYLNVTLAIDALTMDLHTHESFEVTFKYALQETLKYKHVDRHIFEMDLAMGRIRKKYVEDILGEYQLYLNDRLGELATEKK